MAETATPPSPARSPARLALRRLSRHRAAMASTILLALLTLAGALGPWLSPNPYDRVYAEAIRVPPSLEARPAGDAIEAAARDALARARLEIEAVEVGADTIRITVSATRPIDPRNARYLDRADAFADAGFEAGAEPTTGTLTARVERTRFLLGTDANGRDLLSRILLALGISLAIGALATAVALVIGVAWGATAGFLGGAVDGAMMRIVDVLYALPFAFFVILLVAFFGRDLVLMFVAVGCIEWLDMARIVRGQTLMLRQREFVTAAEALGVRTAAIIRRHILPNLAGPVIVYVTLMVPKVILLESFLSFLGLGVQEPMTSLGVLISEGAKNMRNAPHMLIWPSVALTLLLIALNFLGDGLRDALDPRDR
ncbi:MAG: ABC transporter permease [Pseudomonadota bacterium]